MSGVGQTALGMVAGALGGVATISGPNHYSLVELDGTMEQLHKMFDGLVAEDDDYGWTLNWLFAATDGVHGSPRRLDEIAKSWDDPEESNTITVVLVRPRICQLMYGNVVLDDIADIEWIRHVVRRSLVGVHSSQRGNV